MTNYTAHAIEAAIEIDPEFDGWSMADEWRPAGEYERWSGGVYNREDSRLKLDIDGITEYAEYVDGKMPEEGGGEQIYVVIKVGTQYFRKDGYYLSHDGSYWDGDVVEVRPIEKTITVYEPIGG